MCKLITAVTLALILAGPAMAGSSTLSQDIQARNAVLLKQYTSELWTRIYSQKDWWKDPNTMRLLNAQTGLMINYPIRPPAPMGRVNDIMGRKVQ